MRVYVGSENMRGPRKFCQGASNSDIFFLVDKERELKAGHHRPTSETIEMVY